MNVKICGLLCLACWRPGELTFRGLGLLLPFVSMSIFSCYFYNVHNFNANILLYFQIHIFIDTILDYKDLSVEMEPKASTEYSQHQSQDLMHDETKDKRLRYMKSRGT